MRYCEICDNILESHEGTCCESCLANTFIKCELWSCKQEAKFYDIDAEMNVCYQHKADIVHLKKYGKWATVKSMFMKHWNDEYK